MTIRVSADRAGRTRFDELTSHAPIRLMPGRMLADGTAQVWLVGSAGGPLGGDHTRIIIDVGHGASLRIGSVAASVVLARSDLPSRSSVNARVIGEGRLHWSPEPTIITRRADHRIDVHVELDQRSQLVWKDITVLGRHDETAGQVFSDFHVVRDHRAWIRQHLDLGTGSTTNALVTGSSKLFGSVVHTNDCDVQIEPPDDLEVRSFAIERGGRIHSALADSHRPLACWLEKIERAQLTYEEAG